MTGSKPRTGPADDTLGSSIGAGLRLALGATALQAACVLVVDATTNDWICVTGAVPVSDDELRELAAELTAGSARHVLRNGVIGYPLQGERGLLGALVLAPHGDNVSFELGGPVLDDLIRLLTITLDAASARVEAAFAEQSVRAVRRLFVEGARALDVREAGRVLARLAADTFQTERAGVYVVDDAGLISFAVGVGVTDELSDALEESLNGKVAASSPVWQTLERLGGPDLVNDARTRRARSGGFVETMGFLSYIAIPLMSADGPLGMVICGEASRRRTWNLRERKLAEQFAVEGALIVDAARLRTAQREQVALLSHQAHHDGLTGLANRRMLMIRLDEVLDAARAGGSKVALLLLDLNDFKRVNDTLGHRYGDELLQEVAKRLQQTTRTSDTLARLGGDEFAIVLPEVSGQRRALATALRVERALAEPVVLDGVGVNAMASVGIAMFPDQAETSAGLLQHADVAMYEAKRSRNGAVVYDHTMDDATVDRLSLYTELRNGIARGELRLHYQPKLDLQRNVVVGVESLVRWQHPRRGLLLPADFLGVAEASELIHPLTAWVFTNAIAQHKEWTDQGLELIVAVNISARNLLNHTLLTRGREQLRASGAPERFVVEVTETAVMTDPEQSIAALKEIRDLGVRISMDDFGTGQSSLALLSQLPVDELKIDRQLVRAVDASAQDRALVDTIIHLGHRLGLQVVAEGIETAELLQTMQELGCDLAQGYYISRPVDGAAITELMAERARPPWASRGSAYGEHWLPGRGVAATG